MTVHLTARLAWHRDGWNGHVCSQPERNTYCIGGHSYPGDLIARKRDLAWEKEHAGRSCAGLDRVPPCIYSLNAFGDQQLTAFADPPDFFNNETQTAHWPLPPATVCVWPYEQMYRDEVRKDRGYDNDLRWTFAQEFFSQIERDASLIFYYANYSNPFSEDESPRYVLVGISRVKEVGPELFYTGCNEETKRRYGGGYVWDRNVSSHYPDQGLRLPYHRYADDEDKLAKFAVFPENPLLCKYGSKLLTDDQALGLVEQLMHAVDALIEMGDQTEDWSRRLEWLQQVISELWRRRGAYPGLPAVCFRLDFAEAVNFLRQQVDQGREAEAAAAVWAVIEGRAEQLPGALPLAESRFKSIRRQWTLLDEGEQRLMKEVLPRLSLDRTQVARIFDATRAGYGLQAEAAEIAENPYLLSEQYVGDTPDDRIAFSLVDRGVIPSPELGIAALATNDDARRLRALLWESLGSAGGHTFMEATSVLSIANRRLSVLPGWKRASFHERYLVADADTLAGALEVLEHEGKRYVYRKSTHEDEDFVRGKFELLLGRQPIQLQRPMTEKNWRDFLFDRDSAPARRAAADYSRAIDGQVQACMGAFNRPLAVLCGEAGTGKTTVVKAIARAIRKVAQDPAGIVALAPTGKAADRLRETLEAEASLRGQVEVMTIHALLAKRGWLNDNLTFKKHGGETESGYATYIIDECSMIDLHLMAALFRAIKWTTVQRLLLVGDPNQLPPIGTGRVFADVVEHLRREAPDAVVELKDNLRQMVNRAEERGTGILTLASLYRQRRLADTKDEDAEIDGEQFLRKVQEGGEVDSDLRVIYWNEPAELAGQLIAQLTQDLIADGGAEATEPFYKIWDKAFNWRPEYSQILSPCRGDLYGTEALNQALQKHKSSRWLDRGALDGITMFDKVIQIRNRTRSDPIFGYDFASRQVVQVDVFNGELGFVGPHGYDRDDYLKPHFRLHRFAVAFSRKGQIRVNYGDDLGHQPNGRHIPRQRVEENLELGYAISVHKAQGSEFERIYVVIPAGRRQLLSQELLYTALTRAKRHCTLLVEKSLQPLLDMRRRERSVLARINSSLFDWHIVPEAMLDLRPWYEAGKIHRALSGDMVRSKSEVIIANMLFDRDIDFLYEVPLYAPDGTMYLPDFTISYQGQQLYWEHVGMLSNDEYRRKWQMKRAWYEKHFPGRLLTTYEGPELSRQAVALIEERLG
jgi:hypothetical protein